MDRPFPAIHQSQNSLHYRLSYLYINMLRLFQRQSEPKQFSRRSLTQIFQMKKSTTQVFSKQGFSKQGFPKQLLHIFSHPFEFTLSAYDLQYFDKRFKEVPVEVELQEREKQRVVQTLQLLAQLISRQKQEEIEQSKDITGQLINRCRQFVRVNKQIQLQIKVEMIPDTITKSKGLLDIKPIDMVLDLSRRMQIHKYALTRHADVLEIKEWKRKTSSIQKEQQTEMGGIMEQQVKLIVDQTKQIIEEKIQKEQRAKLFIEKLSQFILRDPAAKVQSFRNYYRLESITGSYSCQLTENGKQPVQLVVPFVSKWITEVDKKEREEQTRKRNKVLCDFQYWNRGIIFQLHDFAEDMA